MLEAFDKYIYPASSKYNVPISWIKAVIMTESSGDPMAYRAEPRINDASYGLMQLLTRTAKGLGFTGSPNELYDPAINIDLGTKLLGQLRNSYGDDFQRIYSAYNSGSPDKYLTSTQVATNVKRAVNWLTSVIENEPVIASSGIAGLLVAALIWYYVKNKKK